MASSRRADIAALVRRLQGGSLQERLDAVRRLALMHEDAGDSASRTAVAEAIASGGGIPAVVQLTDSRRRESEYPAVFLGNLAFCSPARCQAIIAAHGIAPLVRCLDSSSLPRVQAAAAGALVNLASANGGGEAGAAAIAAVALPGAVRCLSSSNTDVLQRTSSLPGNMADDSPERRQAAVTAGAIPPLLHLLRHQDRVVVARAAAALSVLTCPHGGASSIAAVEAAGGISLLVQLLASSSDASAVESAVLSLYNVACSGPASAAAEVIEAGGVAALVRCLQGQRFTSTTHEYSATFLGHLASHGAQPSQIIADSGGARALVQALAQADTPRPKLWTAIALVQLLLNGQAAAVAAADASNAVTAALEWLPSFPSFPDSPGVRADVTRALRLLAAARVCAAPGCSATSGLKRCAGCGSVRYCGEACMRAHWKEHRPECKRLRAAAAAAGGAAGPSRQP